MSAKQLRDEVFQSVCDFETRRVSRMLGKKRLELVLLGIMEGRLGIWKIKRNNFNIIDCKLISSTRLFKDSSL
jgi:hypothetical protein